MASGTPTRASGLRLIALTLLVLSLVLAAAQSSVSRRRLSGLAGSAELSSVESEAELAGADPLELFSSGHGPVGLSSSSPPVIAAVPLDRESGCRQWDDPHRARGPPRAP